jgi:hypothetical protein
MKCLGRRLDFEGAVGWSALYAVKVITRLRREVRILRAVATFRANRVRHGIRPTMEYWPVLIQNGGIIRIGDRAGFSGAEAAG